MPGKKKIPADLSTEEKIREAARTVFTQKGYAATRTRDIAEEAGINLALLNYYFRSKEKLFEVVMAEKVQQLFGVIAPVMNDSATSLEQKIELIAVSYIEVLSRNPDLPLFVLSELRRDPEQLSRRFQARSLLRESVFVQQLQQRKPDIHPIQFIVSLLGMSLFPFLSRPILVNSGGLNQKAFDALVEARKTLVPMWMKAILDCS